jgi:hypothetical protein
MIRSRPFLSGKVDSRTSGTAGKRYTQRQIPRYKILPPLPLPLVSDCVDAGVSSIWHPLKGPNQDWPLALCDVTTLDPQRDLEIADYVTPLTNREHCLVYARDTCNWWYLSQ